MAKLRPEQLDAAVRKQLAPIYLISGDETLLIQECCDSIRSAARNQGFSERVLYHADRSFEWNLLLNEANSLSLFSDKKIIELRIETGKPGDQGSKALVEYSQQPSEDNLLLVITPKLDGNAQRSKWFKSLEKAGVTVQVWPISEQQMPHWLNQRLNQAGLNANKEALNLLAAQVEGNLLAAAQEVEKLKLLATDGEVTKEIVSGMVTDSARYDVFNLVDKALNRDAKSAVKCLHGLRSEGTEAISVLWALTREIRTLLQVAHSLEQGKQFDWACKVAGVWDKRKSIVRQALQGVRVAQLQLLLRKANAVDKSIKGMRDADPWDELLDLTLNLCGAFPIQGKSQKLALTLS